MPDPPMEDTVFGALVTTFGVITLGYILGRSGVLPADERGLARFIGTVALPALVFTAIGTLDFATVQWKVVAAIALAKTFVFVLTVGLSMLVGRGPWRAGRAGLRGLFVTMSNDFALGLPLLRSLYPQAQQDVVVQYLYLTAPIQALWLNPICFALIEYSSARATAAECRSKRGIVTTVLLGVIRNPFVLMTLAGLVVNLAWKGSPPAPLAGAGKVLGDAFSGAALVVLGMSTANRLNVLRGWRLLDMLLLVGVKIILLPFVVKGFVDALHPSTEMGVDAGNFGAPPLHAVHPHRAPHRPPPRLCVRLLSHCAGRLRIRHPVSPGRR